MIDSEQLRIQLAYQSAVIAVQCAQGLAELGLLYPERSVEVEKSIRVMAEICQDTGGQVAETVFLKSADWIARFRAELPPPKA